jgi:hypothetical protein
MADPATTARGTPSGIKMDDGFSTRIAFALAPTIGLWEKDVQPPGMDGGEPVNTTTMLNTKYRTFAPRYLVTSSPLQITVAYDPLVYTTVISTLLNKRGSITVHFPDGTTLDFYGFLQKFEPSPLKEGEQPEAKITVVVTNYDPVNHLEVDPKLTNVAGT